MLLSKKITQFLLPGFMLIFMLTAVGSGISAFAANFKMIKNLSIPAGESYPASIMSWGGTLHIDGNLKGSIILLGGQLELDGVVEEDVICVSSKIRIGRQTLIKGALFVIGGKLNRHPQSTVKGEYLNFKVDLKKIESTLIPILSDSRSVAFFKVLKIIFWLIITLLVFAVVPKQVNHAEEIFHAHILKMGLLGILSDFTFIFLLFAFIVMSFIIIGIPLLFLLIIFYFAIYIFGRTVLFYFIGLRFSHLLKLRDLTPALFIVMGAAFYAILKFIPFVGPLILILMNILEVGISIGFLLRKKLKIDT
jgi:hypothetical protein